MASQMYFKKDCDTVEDNPRAAGYPITCPLCGHKYRRFKMGTKKSCPKCDSDSGMAQAIIIEREIQRNDERVELLRGKMLQKPLSEAEVKFVDDWIERRADQVKKSMVLRDGVRTRQESRTVQTVQKKLGARR